VTYSAFAARHIGLTGENRTRALAALGLGPDDSVIEQALPSSLRHDPPDLPPPLTEAEVLAELASLAARNTPPVAMIGLGYHACHIPPVLTRNIIEAPGWYTAYTPYQPEISQGRLEALLTFQTMIADLTGLPIASASLLDEGTAVVEAMNLAVRHSRGRRSCVAVDSQMLPQTLALLATRAAPVDITLLSWDPATQPLPPGVAAAIVQYQGVRGRLLDLEPIANTAHDDGALLVVAADPLALTLLRAPGDAGADIVVGSTGRFGMPLGFGGPHAAYMAVRQGLERQIPGRIVGISKDSGGAPALRLALQTREQHIRREKATSNICTAQVLPAVVAAMYAAWHGPDGLSAIAGEVHAKAVALGRALREGGVEAAEVGFDIVHLSVPGRAAEVKAQARRRGIAVWADGSDAIGVSVDETTTSEHLRAVASAFGVEWTGEWGEVSAIPEALRRGTSYLTHPVFHRYRTEQDMTRYLRRLEARDYGLDRGMIPLGSCTMKLNSAVEMAALTWPGFASLHPFCEREDAAGTLEMIADLETWLGAITGYDAVSLQPNAGSQGELAGLLAIRAYHAARGESGRRVCLVPESAHGTNPASAALAGLSVVSVATCDDGSIDVADLRAAIAARPGEIAAIMLTYPSTYGVYEEGIAEVCSAVHDAGGQVFIDGANFNAMAGWAMAGRLGGDVSHLNLHKTFAMPHGGGGPGVGPVAARSHLAQYLPGSGAGNVSAAPFGSALLFPISWAYIRLMGARGLAEASEGAVLAANYVARRLEGAYPVLYRGQGGFVAHECILDVRTLSAATGATVDDVAKRLQDYGFHAPTMSFPVAGTLMVEPTESEPIGELDRFCEAMLAIAAEAEVWGGGGPLAGAPHTAACLVAEEWDRPYSRQTAVFPAGVTPDKYWPPVGRIDSAWGDRNLQLVWP